jgi:hypothetical protein
MCRELFSIWRCWDEVGLSIVEGGFPEVDILLSTVSFTKTNKYGAPFVKVYKEVIY